MITKLTGQLEIDHERGVIYFHTSEGKLAGSTVFRICRLPKPIPQDQFIDVTHMYGVNYNAKMSHQR